MCKARVQLQCDHKQMSRILYLKSNKRYIFLINFSIKLQFSLQECKFKAIFTFKKSEHALLVLIDQICDSFNDKNYFLGISKAFDIADYSISLKQLEHYGIKGRNLSWFQSYLSTSKQYIEYKQENKTGNRIVKYNLWSTSRFNSWAIAFHNLC